VRRARHVLFVALAGHGHVTPTLPLVEELVQRGHRVAYATAGDFADVVTGAGARWVHLPPMAPLRPPAQVGPDLIASWFRPYFAAMRATHPVLHEYCRTARPDAVCYDVTNWPARLVAHHLGIPRHAADSQPGGERRVLARRPAHRGARPGPPQIAALAEDCSWVTPNRLREPRGADDGL
jgi:UDP:flavonoid glycosyltransferase YjiC (YdhE family)